MGIKVGSEVGSELGSAVGAGVAVQLMSVVVVETNPSKHSQIYSL